MGNIITKAIWDLMEKTIADHGSVTAIRAWEPATMIEVDLHIPGIDMSRWRDIQRLKIKVGDFDFRDYTPAVWSAQKRVCTLYIETGHDGTGSAWARALRKGDIVSFGAAYAASVPRSPGAVLCLGDGSAMGHFLALGQLTSREDHPLAAVIFLPDDYWLPQRLIRQHPEFQFIADRHGDALTELAAWVEANDLSEYAYIYISGHTPMVKALRRIIKDKNDLRSKIIAAGFWK